MYVIIICILQILCNLYYRKTGKSKKSIIILNVITTTIYIMWRFTTIPMDSMGNFLMGCLVLLAEVLGIGQFIVFMSLFYKKYKLTPKYLADFKDGDLPSVDILICTYNESIRLLEKTIVAAKHVEYPYGKKEIYVCDDGNRKELRELCKKCKVKYLAREDNVGAKAGNINHALQYTKGELFAVLDADMLPKKEFLIETVSYFSDEKVGFVQTPQAYYNQDMYQYNLRENVPNEQDFFMRKVQEARAAHGATLHVGTNAVFSKEAVLEVGGYPTCSITEDMALGMLLQAKKYKTYFINKVLVIGLSATTYSELLLQRDRWCRGNLQVSKHYNPLTMKGLTFFQRIAYIDGVIYWCSSIQKLIFLLAPICYLTFGIRAIQANVGELLYVFIPYFLGQCYGFKILSADTRNLLWAHIYEVATAPFISFSILKEMLGLKIKFNVTPKNGVNQKAYFQTKLSIPHICLATLSLVSIVFGIMKMYYDPQMISACGINLFWCSYNLFAILICCRLAYQKPMLRESQRMKLKDEVLVEIRAKDQVYYGAIDNLSDYGMKVIIEKGSSWQLEQEVELCFLDFSLIGEIKRVQDDSLGIMFSKQNHEAFLRVTQLYVDNIRTYYEFT